MVIRVTFRFNSMCFICQASQDEALEIYVKFKRESNPTFYEF